MATVTFGAVAGNASDPTKWVGGAKPTNADDVVFDASSANCVADEAIQGRSLDMTAYAATLSGSSGITITAPAVPVNVKLGGTLTAIGTLTITTASGQVVSLYCNGKQWGGAITCGGSGTVSRADATSMAGAWVANCAVLGNGYALTHASAAIGAASYDIANCLVTLTGNGNIWTINAGATLSAAGSTLAHSDTGATACTLALGAFTYGQLSLPSRRSQTSLTGNFGYTNLAFYGTPGPRLLRLPAGSTVTVAGSTGMAGYALTTERVLNPGFETAGSPFANWTTTIATGGAVVSDTGHAGSAAAKVSRGTAATTYVAQQIPVCPGSTYRLTVWVKGDGTNAGQYGIYNVTGSAYITALTTTGVTAASWTQITADFTAPAQCATVELRLAAPTVNSTSTWFDDVSCVYLSGNLIDASTRNGGFETAGGGGADVFGSWSEAASGSSTVTADTGRSGSGNSCKLTIDGSNNVAQVAQLVAGVGRMVRVSFWAKVDSTAGSPSLAVASSANQALVYPTTSWAQYVVCLITDATSIVIKRNAGANRSFWIDDVVVTETFQTALTTDTAGTKATLVSPRNRTCDYLHLRDVWAQGGGACRPGANSTNGGNTSGWLWSEPLPYNRVKVTREAA